MAKQKLIAIIIICSVLFAGTVGGVVAYMIKISEQKKGDFAPAKVSCKLEETFDANQKSNITVTNDNSNSNIDVFVRVRLVTYWVDASGNVINKAPAPISFTLGDDWIKSANSDTYYYKTPLAVGTKTSDLLNGQNLTLHSEDGCRQVIDVFAEAIQANPAEAAQSSWGVTVTNNQITAVQ